MKRLKYVFTLGLTILLASSNVLATNLLTLSNPISEENKQTTIIGVWHKESGALYVPIRELATAINCKMEWDKKTQVIKLSGELMYNGEQEWYLCNNMCSVNRGGDYCVSLLLPPKIINDQFCVPVNMLEEIFGDYATKPEQVLFWDYAENTATFLFQDNIVRIVSPVKIKETAKTCDVVAEINKLRTIFPKSKYWGHLERLEEGPIDFGDFYLYKHGYSYYAGLTINESPLAYSDVFCCYGPKEGLCTNEYRSLDGANVASECAGFAMYCSDYIFGYDASCTKVNGDYNAIKVGDVIHINNKHYALVISKCNNFITVAEANFNEYNKINWDRKIYKKDLEKGSFYTITRY